ncbi:hypothetical protein [Kitasatospora sp. NPDC097643]|uniref:hypothetical protein n=1 Tax=Kitasatospora sp. NPDC097643 TaxID=3157230 RepID=UPI0033187DFD
MDLYPRYQVPRQAVYLVGAATVMSTGPALLFLVPARFWALVLLLPVLAVAAPLANARNRAAFQAACTTGAVVAGIASFPLALIGFFGIPVIGAVIGWWVSLFGPATLVLLAARRVANSRLPHRDAMNGGWLIAVFALGTWGGLLALVYGN